MRRLFADSFYWIALLFRRDAWHGRVAAFSRTLTENDTVFTSDAVLIEFLAAVSAAGPRMRELAAAQVDAILADPYLHVAEITRAQFLDGLSLYKFRPDKAYSLTDCISMQVMRREGISEVLSNDHHFR
jgi:predicted nucleic acid-binding protein